LDLGHQPATPSLPGPTIVMVRNDEQAATGFPQVEEANVKLNIVFMSIGTRGDIQPHLAIAKVLQQRYGHRVRIVASDLYRAMIEAEGVEFYSWGHCDPREMGRRRMLPRKEMNAFIPTIMQEFKVMNERYWKACIGDPEGIPDDAETAPFVADAVIGVMQTSAHSWAASRMGIPIRKAPARAQATPDICGSWH
jgi:UDP:flavonoid glycosyltransferase YjiC (YdhE family)